MKRPAEEKKGSHRSKPLFVWRARKDLNPRPLQGAGKVIGRPPV